MTVAALRKFQPDDDGYFDLDDTPRHLRVVTQAVLGETDATLAKIRKQLPEQVRAGVITITAQDLEGLEIVDRARFVDNVDYTGLFDYDDD